MEEASVAGESPDRSKQRASSEEPTPGSAGPVPEARSEAEDSARRRDPRLAVSREPSPSGSAESPAPSDTPARGGVDTATRVLSVRETATADAEDAEDAEETEDASDASDADEPGTGGAGDAGSPESTGDAEDAVDSTAGTDTDGGTDEADADGDAAADDASRADDATGGASAERDDSAATGDARLRAAVAAWVRTADEAQDARPARDDDTAGDEADTEDGADTDADASEPPAPTAPTKPLDDAAADGTDADVVPSAEDTPEAATPPSGASDAPEDATDGPDDSDVAAPASADDTPDADREDRDDRDDREDRGDRDDDRTARADENGQNGQGGQDGRDDDGGDAEGGDDAGDRKGPVDQPTAVFTTLRPSERPVDQPTTMLKLGDAAKASAGPDTTDTAEKTGKPDKAGRTGKGTGTGEDDRAGSDSPEAPEAPGSSESPGTSEPPESPAERTSKFVALKPLDDPGLRKPPVTDATTALRTVTPAAPPADATSALPQAEPERTTQQPLPPKPPLDLLAELTNTPPPPETPLRTAVRRVKIWTPLVLLLVIIFAVVQNMRPLPEPTLDLTAEDRFTFEGGKVDIPWPADGQAALDVQGIGSFGSSGEQKPVPIASVAKVMTAYVILRDHPLKSGAQGPMIKIDEPAEKQSDAGQESTVDVTAGDEISQREALESILIASANNVARLLARWDAGSEKAFVEKMNAAAEDLGMTNTTYTDPSGLNNTTVSTAVDQVKLGKAAMKQPAFREVAAMMSYDDYKGVNHSNWNQLVGHNNVVGIKTGTTTSALGNLLFAAKKDVDGEMRTIVGAVVRQPAGGKDNTILSAALTAGDDLIRAAQGALESATILKKGTVVGYADDGLGGRTPVVVTEDVKAVGWAGLSVKLTFAADKVPHEAKAGTEVGSLTVGDGTSSAVKVPVALQDDLVEPGFTDKLTRLA
ncbi:D-alanyl-D-alanine carboxypeptidase [Streptomyces sp. SID8111]|uniref:D-alanyl-D-alanine carboxypeptidase n=1 Tax=Streptomyces sp. SID8111 TaxID=2706100 RepID=UPI0013C282CB|nr:D-alanyl-D-alanine carboxypeptidase [Streptomyces sp. SID8111]NEC30592.1 D-alanyl-D-alanine carboxypeptidase [Streptomyces sp. SID8111]